MTQTATTVTIVSPRCTPSLDANGLIVLTPVVPEVLDTHVMTWDSVTVQAFVGRCCDVQHYQPVVPDPNNPGNTMANPAPPASAALTATHNFWIGEASIKSQQIGQSAQASAVAASAASALGIGMLSAT